jgi:hypothetical protein
MNDSKKPVVDGVAERGVSFDDQANDRWAIARQRWEAHKRGEAGTMSVEEFSAALRAEVARQRKAAD